MKTTHSLFSFSLAIVLVANFALPTTPGQDAGQRQSSSEDSQTGIPDSAASEANSVNSYNNQTDKKNNGIGYDYEYLDAKKTSKYAPKYGYGKYSYKSKGYAKYKFKGYPTDTGYINPNYQYPDREDIDLNEEMDEAMRELIYEQHKSMEEVLPMFYPEQHDVFWQMDQVADPKTGELHPLNLDKRGVMGRNTWILWCGGNQWFWDWIASEGVGVLDFLHLLDSRRRQDRFAMAGLCNQPGMATNLEPGPYGLFLDKVVQPLTDRNGVKLNKYYEPWGDGDSKIESDGVNPKVYGYPSGVIGFRLFPNPDFDEEAKAHWDAHAFYTDRAYRSNPKLERPLKVGMTCALCHVAAHPLNPPLDPAEPRWDNLSAIIGNQYFRTSAILGNQTTPTNFLNQFLMNQQPGTVDTSMTSTDWISNSNAMNGVFEFQARMHRALHNPSDESTRITYALDERFQITLCSLLLFSTPCFCKVIEIDRGCLKGGVRPKSYPTLISRIGF